MRQRTALVALLYAFTMIAATAEAAQAPAPGTASTPESADTIQDLVSPGNYQLVKQGMRMNIVAPGRLEWPPPYKSATEKYASQVGLTPDGDLKNYVAGLPFPSID